MKENLKKYIDTLVAGELGTDSDALLREYVAAVARDILAEMQLELFGSEKESKPEKRYLVKPMGVSYDDLAEAKSVANNNHAKKATVVDSETGEEVHKGKKPK